MPNSRRDWRHAQISLQGLVSCGISVGPCGVIPHRPWSQSFAGFSFSQDGFCWGIVAWKKLEVISLKRAPKMARYRKHIWHRNVYQILRNWIRKEKLIFFYCVNLRILETILHFSVSSDGELFDCFFIDIFENVDRPCEISISHGRLESEARSLIRLIHCFIWFKT